jgi:hydroxymethylpyrimidine pyrophosphatase-like HAD family hydrolase
MFHQVGMAIAMGNANPKLKDIANYVTKPVWEDGILHAVEHLKLV